MLSQRTPVQPSGQMHWNVVSDVALHVPYYKRKDLESTMKENEDTIIRTSIGFTRSLIDLTSITTETSWTCAIVTKTGGTNIRASAIVLTWTENVAWS